MKKPNKILFIQLPLINHDHDYALGNIEYASAAIAGFIQNRITSHIEITNLPFLLTHFGSDALLIKYILDYHPDFVGFTCFLWNIERNLAIAQKLKEQDDDIVVVFGGSEINYGSISLSQKRDYVDYFVIGEGEWFFSNILSGNDTSRYQVFENGNRILIQPESELIPAAGIFEPYTGKRLRPMPDGSMFFELTRGCAYRCSYCLYSKNYHLIREIPFNYFINALSQKQSIDNLKEIYILSPALNTTKDFKKKLIQLSQIRHNTKLHSEIRGEGINASVAKLLYKAGFRSMEVGLQTLNMDSLIQIGRKSNPEKELQGIRCLKNAGIDVTIGIIPGLPHDTYYQFIDMIDKLLSMGFGKNIELYPLMLLPGTAIRESAAKFDINFNKKPPYYYNYGWGMTYEEIISIVNYVEKKTGYSYVTWKLPDFTSNPAGEYIKGISFNGDDINNWDINLYIGYIGTNVFSFFINLLNSKILYNGINKLLENLPKSELYNLIIYYDSILNEKNIIESICLHSGDHLISRMNIFHEWRKGLQVQVYQVFKTIDEYKTAKNTYSIIIPIVVMSEYISNIPTVIYEDDNILILNGTFKQYKKFLTQIKFHSPESVAFEDETEQEEFYQMIGFEYTKIPFQSRIIKV